MTMAAVLSPLFQGVDKESAGYKLLSSMGWKEGEGLGANKQGITEHVKVKKKFDAMGVGAAETANTQRDWTTGMVGFDRILANLKEVTAARPVTADSSDDSDCDSASKEAAKAKKSKKSSKKADKAVAAAGSGKAKRKRAAASSPSSGSGASSSSSGSDSDSDDSSKGGAPAPSAKRVKLASHVGRYHKRERAKLVKGYSNSDLEAILGGITNAKEAAAAEEQEQEEEAAGDGGVGAFPSFRIPEVRAVRADDSSDSEGEDEGPAANGAAARTAQPGGSSVPQPEAQRPKAKAKAQPEPEPESWEPGNRPWWAGMFVRAGRMGSIRKELKGGETGKAKINVSGFREEDQENLYERAQSGAAHGRQGLGRADAPKKVAGARWCGTKTKLDEDDEDADADEAESSGAGSDSEEDTGIVVVQSKKEQAEAAATGAGGSKESPAAAAGASGKGSKGKEGKKRKQKEQATAAAATEAEAEPPQEAKPKKKKKKSKDGKAAGADASEPAEPADADAAQEAEDGSKRPKWRKLVRQLLADAPERRLKLKALKKQLAAEHGLGGKAENEGKQSAMAAVLEQLRGSSKFKVCEKFVTLA